METLGLSTVAMFFIISPGYIFIHTLDNFLLRREKSQFEKTVQGLCASFIILSVSLIMDIHFFNAKTVESIKFVFKPENYSNIMDIMETQNFNSHYIIFCIFFLSLCFFSFLISVLFARLRKVKIIDFFIGSITKRNYFQNTALDFYYNATSKMVIIKMLSGEKYKGILYLAPDNEKDIYIDIKNPILLSKTERKIVNYQTDKILINTNDVVSIELIKENDKNDR